MEPNETVLSDIHIDMSHTRPFDRTTNLVNDKYAGHLFHSQFGLFTWARVKCVR